MRRLVLVTVLAFGVGAAPATGEEPPAPFSVELKMTPMKAGTRDRPKGVELSVKASFEPPPANEDSPVLKGGRLLVPRGIVLNGGRYPTCSRAVMERDDSIVNCPKRSVVGALQKGLAAVDPPFGTRPAIVLVNGGPRRLWAFTTYYYPALVQIPVPIDVRPLRGRRWAYELTFEIPKVVRVVAGVPVGVPDRLHFRLGGRPHARRFVETNRGCPVRGYLRYEGSLSLERYPERTVSTTPYRGRLACR